MTTPPPLPPPAPPSPTKKEPLLDEVVAPWPGLLVRILKLSVEIFPANKLAVGVGGIVAVAGLCLWIFSGNWRGALYGGLAVLAGMIVLSVLFTTHVKKQSAPVKVLIWAIVLLVIAISCSGALFIICDTLESTPLAKFMVSHDDIKLPDVVPVKIRGFDIPTGSRNADGNSQYIEAIGPGGGAFKLAVTNRNSFSIAVTAIEFEILDFQELQVPYIDHLIPTGGAVEASPLKANVDLWGKARKAEVSFKDSGTYIEFPPNDLGLFEIRVNNADPGFYRVRVSAQSLVAGQRQQLDAGVVEFLCFKSVTDTGVGSRLRLNFR